MEGLNVTGKHDDDATKSCVTNANGIAPLAEATFAVRIQAKHIATVSAGKYSIIGDVHNFGNFYDPLIAMDTIVCPLAPLNAGVFSLLSLPSRSPSPSPAGLPRKASAP